MVKISVIIPVYNVEKYLSRCLDSIVNQTLRNIEIICVDDGSTDNSLEILKLYAIKDNRIKIITQENAGAGAARNKGLEIACGEYLYFMDSDDYANTDLLEKLYSKIIKTNSDICICKTRYCSNISISGDQSNKNSYSFSPVNLLKKIYYDKKIFNRHNSPKNLFQICNVPVYTKLYRHEFIKRNGIKFQEIKSCNDVFFNFYSLACAESIALVDEKLINHVEREDSITSSRDKTIECVLIAYTALEKELNKHNMLEELRGTLYKRERASFKYELKQIRDVSLRKSWAEKLNGYLLTKNKYFNSAKFYCMSESNAGEYPKEFCSEYLKR